MSKPLVSVVINTFNRPRLISRALESIISQSYVNLEILVYDAGTTEETKTVVSSFSDPRIVYRKVFNEVSQANTFNLAFRESRGKYIAWQDDDDESMPLRIEKQVGLIESFGPDVGAVYCWEDFYDDGREKFLYTNKSSLQGEIFKQLLEKPGGTGGGTQLLLNREALLSVGGVPENIRIASDYLMMLNISRRYKIYCLSETLVKTHVNHFYERLTEIGGINRGRILGGIELSEFILQFYSEEFKTFNVSKHYHLRTLAFGFAKLRNLKCLRYFLLYCLSTPYLNLVTIPPDFVRVLRYLYISDSDNSTNK